MSWREAFAWIEMAAGDKFTGLALFAETEILKIEQDRVGEVIIGLEHVHVGRFDAGHAEGFAAGDDTRSDREIGTLGDMPLEMRLSGTDNASRLLRASRARSRPVTMTTPPPSVTRQQSSLCSGSQIIGEANTSSTVRGSRIHAFGLSDAHFRAATATRARCSGVAPHSCI